MRDRIHNKELDIFRVLSEEAPQLSASALRVKQVDLVECVNRKVLVILSYLASHF